MNAIEGITSMAQITVVTFVQGGITTTIDYNEYGEFTSFRNEVLNGFSSIRFEINRIIQNFENQISKLKKRVGGVEREIKSMDQRIQKMDQRQNRSEALIEKISDALKTAGGRTSEAALCIKDANKTSNEIARAFAICAAEMDRQSRELESWLDSFESNLSKLRSEAQNIKSAIYYVSDSIIKETKRMVGKELESQEYLRNALLNLSDKIGKGVKSFSSVLKKVEDQDKEFAKHRHEKQRQILAATREIHGKLTVTCDAMLDLKDSSIAITDIRNEQSHKQRWLRQEQCAKDLVKASVMGVKTISNAHEISTPLTRLLDLLRRTTLSKDEAEKALREFIESGAIGMEEAENSDQLRRLGEVITQCLMALFDGSGEHGDLDTLMGLLKSIEHSPKSLKIAIPSIMNAMLNFNYGNYREATNVLDASTLQATPYPLAYTLSSCFKIKPKQRLPAKMI